MQQPKPRATMRVQVVCVARRIVFLGTGPGSIARSYAASIRPEADEPLPLVFLVTSRRIMRSIEIAPLKIGKAVSSAWHSFTSPTHAIPVDLFRILVGLNSAAYFVRLAKESSRLYGPFGLLDPVLTRELFPYARWTPLHPSLPGIGVRFFQTLYVASATASFGLSAGYWVRPLSVALFVVAASVFRWNIPAVYLDDAMVHVMLLWVSLMPTGHTLTIPEWRRRGPEVIHQWTKAQVPGTAVRSFLVNLALVYGVAGAWKWTSPMWRQGVALYAGLKMAVAHDPDHWHRRHLPLLRAGNFGALLLETFVPLGMALPAGHPLKVAMGVGLLCFHLGVIATLKIPFANLACIAAMTLVFRQEIMMLFRHGAARTGFEVTAPLLELQERGAIALVVTIAMAMLVDALRPRWRSGTHDSVRNSVVMARSALRAAHNPFAALLWLIGVAQSYRLFDWIDERNYHITHNVVESSPTGSVRVWNDRAIFPRTQRDVLLQSYLHDVMWIKVPRDRLAEYQFSLFERYAGQFCRAYGHTGTIRITRNVQRVDATNLDLRRPVRQPFLEFSCCGGTPVIRFARLSLN